MDEIFRLSRAEVGLWTTERGEAVWPCSNSREEACLVDFALERDLEIEWVGAPIRARPGKTAFEASGNRDAQAQGVVWWVGDGLEAPASLYAHLTGRTIASRLTDGAEPGAAGPDVVLALPDRVDGALLHRLYRENQRAWAPGLIMAPCDEMRQEVLLRSAAACFGGSFEKRAVEVYPGFALGMTLDGPVHVVGGDASDNEMTEALDRSAELVGVVTHSDGIDAPLGRFLAMCAMAGRPQARNDLGRVPYCVATSHCYRFNVALEDAIASSATFDAWRMRGRILVLAVCRGLLLQGGTLDPQHGLLARVLKRGWASVVTGWSQAEVRNSHVLDLLLAIHEGMPVGQALALYNASSDGGFALIGDPSPRLERDSSVIERHPLLRLRRSAERRLPKEQPPPLRAPDAELGFIAHWLECRARSVRSAEHRDLAQRAAEATRAAEEDPNAPDPGDAIWAVLTGSGRAITHDWLPTRIGSRRLAPVPCPNCNDPLEVSESWFASASVAQRRLSICGRCGVAQDGPLDMRAFLRVDANGDLVLENAPSGPGIRAILAVASRVRGSTQAWPVSGDVAASRYRLQALPGCGPLEIQLFLFVGSALTMAGLQSYADAFAGVPITASEAAPGGMAVAR